MVEGILDTLSSRGGVSLNLVGPKGSNISVGFDDLVGQFKLDKDINEYGEWKLQIGNFSAENRTVKVTVHGRNDGAGDNARLEAEYQLEGNILRCKVTLEGLPLTNLNASASLYGANNYTEVVKINDGGSGCNAGLGTWLVFAGLALLSLLKLSRRWR